jgi:hypothetical protein
MSYQDKERQARQWAMFIHLSLLAGFVVPFAGFVAPVVIWQIKKEEFPLLDAHGKMAVNWLISSVIYWVICFVLSFVLIGVPLMLVLVVLAVVFPIIAGIKANNDELWKYPLTIQFIK